MKSNTFIEVNPSDSVFFDDVIRKASVCYVTLKNITSQKVAFKIKTTSPKDYVVKPNNGILLPGEDKKIEFTMQPTETLPSSKNAQDKFMIMAIGVGQNFDVSQISDLWKDLQDKAQQAKLIAGFKGAGGVPKLGGFGERKLGNSVSGARELFNNERGSVDEKVRMSMPVTRGRNEMFQSAASPDRFEGANKGMRDDSDQLLTRVRDQEKQILRLTEERNQFFDELTTLKENIERTKMASKGSNKGNYSSYQLWHILLVAIISLIIGAFLSA